MNEGPGVVTGAVGRIKITERSQHLFYISGIVPLVNYSPAPPFGPVSIPPSGRRAGVRASEGGRGEWIDNMHVFMMKML